MSNFFLNQSLWLDEATTAQVVGNFNFLEIIQKFSPTDFHPPLYYLFMDLWTALFGYSEIALRMPSVIFWLLTGWVIYKIAKLLNGQTVGIWAAALFLINPLIIYYSHEARMYMMTTFLLTAALLHFMKLTGVRAGGPPKTASSEAMPFLGEGRDRPRQIIFFSLFCILSFYTFYGSIFLIAAFYLWLLIKKQYRILFVSCVLFLGASAFVAPLLWQQFQNAQVATAAVTNWKQVLGPASLKNLVLIPIKFTTGRIDFHPLFALWSLLVFTFIIKNSIKIKNESLIFLFLVPLFPGFLASFITPLLQYFRFLYLIPILALLLAVSTSKGMYRYILVVGFSAFSLAYIINPQLHREDWRSLAHSLPKEKPVYMILSSSDPLKYYRSDLKVLDIRSIENPSNEIIILPYTADIHGINYKDALMEKNYSLHKQEAFRGLIYEIWRRS